MLEGIITRRFIKKDDNGFSNEYEWGLLIDNEFVACPRLITMMAMAGLKTSAGTKVTINGELSSQFINTK